MAINKKIIAAGLASAVVAAPAGAVAVKVADSSHVVKQPMKAAVVHKAPARQAPPVQTPPRQVVVFDLGTSPV